MNYLINIQHLNKSAFNSYSDEVNLPYGARTYLDSHADEFKRVTTDMKLCYLGGAITRGINLLSVFEEDVDRHVKDPQYGNYEVTAKLSLLDYINYLRESEEDMLSLSPHIKFKTLVNLLIDEILLRYNESTCFDKKSIEVSFTRIPIDYRQIRKRYDISTEKGKDSYLQYILTSEESIGLATISEGNILYFNRWKDVCYLLKYYNLYFDYEVVYPGDEKFVQAYNESQKGKPERQLELHIPPEPWTGNILHSKLVLLSMNPGFVEHLNKSLANILRNQQAEEIMEDKRRILMMDGYYFDYYEATRIMGEYYWKNNITPLGVAVYDENNKDKIFEQVSVCQYLAYSSTQSPNIKELLPSQRFTKMVLFYLASTRKDVKFLVMRATKLWKGLMGEGLWNYLLHHDRLLISEHYRSQCLSEKNIGTDNYNKIVTHLKNK